MKIIIAFAFYFLYWFCCFLSTGTDRKNLAGLRSYPDAVQKAVQEHPVRGKAAPQTVKKSFLPNGVKITNRIRKQTRKSV